jgi:hypothetical protein
MAVEVAVPLSRTYSMRQMNKIKSIIIFVFFFSVPLLAYAQWDPGMVAPFSGLPSSSVYSIIYNVLFWILGIFGMLAVIGFVISGIMYIASAGNEDSMRKAKNAMVYSIIGVVVALSGLVVIYAVDRALRGYSNF